METPIIGILSQEMYIVAKYLPDDKYDSFIAASYVKFLESAGARTIPVWIGQSKEYYQKVVNYTNGILFPGGGTYFNETAGYGETAKIIFELAQELNDRWVHYPLWGICMGLQVLVYSQTGIDLRTDCTLNKVALPLEFKTGFETSHMFSMAPKEVLNTLKTQNVTYNQHRYCLTEGVLNTSGILQDWHILSTNSDNSHVKFISTMEHKKYPFYGVQFHPEKNIFEFKAGYGIPHSMEAVQVSQFFAIFFVNECRKNYNRFPDANTEMHSLIYNYNPVYTAPKGAAYEQIYVFTKDDYKNSPLV
ncbi:hypothetical protein JTB14_017052 [Gonioctena quinquepunctata]|nr:hypothetical protein JTB14_017052 [Gonioctena quinquepunctata]